MKFKLIRLFILTILLFNFMSLLAQDNNDISLDKREYRAELGISGGSSYYLGDASSNSFNTVNTRPSYGGYFRYRIDNRVALKAEVIGTAVAGEGISDNNTVTSDIALEYNFFELEQNPYKRMSKIYSPYLLLGGSFLFYSYEKSDYINPGLTFGLGMKLKLGNRWNLSLQWTNRLLLTDNLEGVSTLNNANNLNGSNIFHNDLLSTLTIGISLDVWRKECNCMNVNKVKN